MGLILLSFGLACQMVAETIYITLYISCTTLADEMYVLENGRGAAREDECWGGKRGEEMGGGFLFR